MAETYSRPPRSLADATDPREFVRLSQLDRTKLYAQPAIACRSVSQSVKANVGDLIVADCVNGQLTISPPDNPADGDRVSLLKVDETANLLVFNAPTHADPTCEFVGRWSGATLIWFASLSRWLVWSVNVGAIGLTTVEGDQRYAAKAHNHDASYSAVGHTHAYAAPDHNHDGTYAPVSHGHSGFAASSHSHDAADVSSGTLNIARVPVAASGVVDPGRVVSANDGRIAWLYTPEDQNLKAWTYDPFMAVLSTALGAGTILATLCEIRDSMTINAVAWNIASAGATPTSGQTRLGVWRFSDRALVLQTGDQSSVVTSTGPKLSAFTATVTLSAGFYYVGIYCQASTRPSLNSVPSQCAQIGRTVANTRSGLTSATYTTALPTTLPTFGSQSNGAPWFGLYQA